MKLSDTHLDILRSAAAHGWYVDEENLLLVADLMRQGLVKLAGGDGIIGVHATEKGMRSAKRRGLIVADSNGVVYSWGPWRPAKAA